MLPTCQPSPWKVSRFLQRFSFFLNFTFTSVSHAVVNSGRSMSLPLGCCKGCVLTCVQAHKMYKWLGIIKHVLNKWINKKLSMEGAIVITRNQIPEWDPRRNWNLSFSKMHTTVSFLLVSVSKIQVISLGIEHKKWSLNCMNKRLIKSEA